MSNLNGSPLAISHWSNHRCWTGFGGFVPTAEYDCGLSSGSGPFVFSSIGCCAVSRQSNCGPPIPPIMAVVRRGVAVTRWAVGNQPAANRCRYRLPHPPKDSQSPRDGRGFVCVGIGQARCGKGQNAPADSVGLWCGCPSDNAPQVSLSSMWRGFRFNGSIGGIRSNNSDHWVSCTTVHDADTQRTSGAEFQ